MIQPAIADGFYRLSAMQFTGFHRCQWTPIPSLARGLENLTRARALTILINVLTAPPS